MFYSIAHSSIISVAVCDEPAGKYQYYGNIHTASGEIIGIRQGDYYQFDPSVFIDDDGEIYFYSGFCGKKDKDENGRLFIGPHVSILENDMLTIKKEPKVILSKNDCPNDAKFFEASSVRKINGLYYFVYSARLTGLHYCTSKYPDSGFTYRGRIHSSSDVGINGHSENNPAYPIGNTHGGIVCINKEYYIFDHRFSNRSSFCRQGVAEHINIDKNGEIKQVEATSCGLNGGPLKGYGTYPIYIACNLIDLNKYESIDDKKLNEPFLTQKGEDRERGENQYLTNFHNNCLVGFKYFEFYSFKGISFKIRGKAKGNINISLQENGNIIGICNVDINSNVWIDVVCTFNISNCVNGLFFKYTGSGSIDILSFELQQFQNKE